jgi:hypothetical protein
MRTIIFVGLVLAAAQVLAQAPGAASLRTLAEESQPSARGALLKFGKLVSEKNATRMGFARPSDLQRAQLDTPLGDFMVRLDELGQYRNGNDPTALLHPTGQVTYPVTVGDKVQSSITLQKADSEWRAVSYGSPMLMAALHDTRDGIGKRERRENKEFFQVRIPAFNMHFIGHMAADKLMLTPVRDMELYGLKKGDTQAAAHIFAALQPGAAQDEGLPR